MNTFTTLAPATEQFLHRALSNHDAAHGYEHAYRVLLNAHQLLADDHLSLSQYDLVTLHITILCHDVFDHKFSDVAPVSTSFGASTQCSPQEVHQFYRDYFTRYVSSLYTHDDPRHHAFIELEVDALIKK